MRSASALAGRLAPSGFNVFGVLSIAAYDALVPPGWRRDDLLPAARSVLVVACGGRAFADAVARDRVAAAQSADPFDRFTEERVREACGRDALPLFYWERRGDPPAFADFVALGRAAGLGAPSRLGQLVHPVYGPWLAIRALCVTVERLTPTGPDPAFTPCEGCPAPCTANCPVAAPTPSGFDAIRCMEGREQYRGCSLRCDARHACVLGQEHAPAADVEARHMRAASRLPVVGGS